MVTQGHAELVSVPHRMSRRMYGLLPCKWGADPPVGGRYDVFVVFLYQSRNHINTQCHNSGIKSKRNKAV